MTNKLLTLAAAALSLTSLSIADAQQRSRAGAAPAAASAAAPRELADGPAIPGMCIFFQGRGIGSSVVGQALEARMRQLRAQAAAEVSGEQNTLANDIKAFQARRASLTQDQLAQQAGPLQQRRDALQQRAEQLNASLEYTFRHQLSRVGDTANPIVQAVYQARHCSLLLNGDADVMASNRGFDITPDVVAQLNTRMTTISFDRETPPATAQ